MQTVISYVATLLAFTLIDLVWLGVVAKDFYRRELGPLMADPINWVAGVAFYVLFAAGIVIFAVMPALAAGGPMRAGLLGAMFGFFAYATYDLTNLATTRGFPFKMALVDMAWGSLLTGMAAALGAAVALRMA